MTVSVTKVEWLSAPAVPLTVIVWVWGWLVVAVLPPLQPLRLADAAIPAAISKSDAMPRVHLLALPSLPARGITRAASANGRDRGASGRRGVLRKELEFDGTATVTVTSVEPAPLVMVVGARV